MAFNLFIDSAVVSPSTNPLFSDDSLAPKFAPCEKIKSIVKNGVFLYLAMKL